ncbi:hypothetical protein [Enterococcus casseliflavus]|uniref:hypothetical protein n=1 Tax=Enterococcus casseliflavus TaxID=37734 RepID=UPI003BAC1F81
MIVWLFYKQISIQMFLKREILYSGLHWVFGIGVLLIVLAIGLTRTISRESGTI